MSFNWDKACVGDFVELQRGNTYKSILLDLPGPYLLGLASIEREGGFRSDKLKTYGGPTAPKLLVYPGDLYVSLKDVTQSGDLLGSVAKVPEGIDVGRMTQDTVKLIFKNNLVSRDYLYWILRSPQYRSYCRARGMGTTNLSLSREDFLSFPVPKINEDRQRIIDLLEAVEAKQALNRQNSSTLEQMAQVIFKSWFVDFDPVRAKMAGRQPECMDAATAALFPNGLVESELGLVPKGWGVEKMGDLTSYLNRGISPKYTEHGGLLVLNQKCVRDNVVDTSKARRHDPSQRKVDGRQLLLGDILVNSTGVGTLGRVAQIFDLEEAIIVDSHVTVIRAKSPVSWNFLGLQVVRRQPEIERLGEGSTGQTELSRGKLAEMKFVVPSLGIIAEFDEKIVCLRRRLSANLRENISLSSLRDTLLSKLLSGELENKEA